MKVHGFRRDAGPLNWAGEDDQDDDAMQQPSNAWK